MICHNYRSDHNILACSFSYDFFWSPR